MRGVAGLALILGGLGLAGAILTGRFHLPSFNGGSGAAPSSGGDTLPPSRDVTAGSGHLSVSNGAATGGLAR